MCNRIRFAADPIGSPSSLDTVESCAYCFVTNGVDVHRKPCQVHGLYIIHDDLPTVLELATGDDALRRMETMGIHEPLNFSFCTVGVGAGAHFLAQL
jgi:hypothetical protein